MAARCFTRRRDLPEKWWVRLSFCSSSLPMAPITVTCKKNTNATTSCLLSFSVFGFRSASVSSLGSVPFLCLISSLSQVAGKEGERARGRNDGWEEGWLLWRPNCREMKERTGMAGRSRSCSWFRSRGCWVCRVGRNCHCWGRLKEKKKTAGAAVAGRSWWCCSCWWQRWLKAEGDASAAAQWGGSCVSDQPVSCSCNWEGKEAVEKEKRSAAPMVGSVRWRPRGRIGAAGLRGEDRAVEEGEGRRSVFQREGKGGCLAKEEREMGAAGDDGGLIRGWQRRRKMGEPTGKWKEMERRFEEKMEGERPWFWPKKFNRGGGCCQRWRRKWWF